MPACSGRVVDIARESPDPARVLPEVTDYCRLFLLRHPELDAVCASRAVGAGPAELSRRGRQRASEWGQVLADEELHMVVAADQPHCLQPAEVLAQARGLECAADERLRDQNMGAWEGRAWDDLVAEDAQQVRAFFEGFADTTPPGGESLGKAVERVLAWWSDTAPGAMGKSIALVTAGSVLSGLVAAWLGMRLSRCLSLNLPHGGIGVVDVFGNGARLTAWNIDVVRR